MEVGRDVSAFRPGNRVVGTCVYGSMAEEAVLDAARCCTIPDAMSFEDAAAVLMTYGTAYYALRTRGRVSSGEKVLILGAGGGVGLAGVQLGKVLGLYVVAAASSPEKLAVARTAGADAGLLYPAGPLSKDESRALAADFKSAARGAIDVVLDAVGGTYCEPALRTMSWEGRYLIVGFPAGIPAPPLNLVLLKGCQLIGVFWGAFIERDAQAFRAMAAELFSCYTSGAIRPYISARYSLENGAEAIAALASRKAVGKVVITLP